LSTDILCYDLRKKWRVLLGKEEGRRKTNKNDNERKKNATVRFFSPLKDEGPD
jgi:hypothetical protein